MLSRLDSTGSEATFPPAKRRTENLRELFDPSHLGALFGVTAELTCLTGAISQDRTPELSDPLFSDERRNPGGYTYGKDI